MREDTPARRRRATTARRPVRVLAVVCLGLVLVAGPGVLAVSGTGAPAPGPDPAEGGVDREVGSLTECFAGDGYPLAIGDPPATIDALVHVSVVTDPTAGDEFGVELAGTLDDEPVVTLAVSVRLNAPGLVATGVNPFAAFDLVYTYELRLPMFGGAIDDTTYREDRPPVGSAAGTVPCRASSG